MTTTLQGLEEGRILSTFISQGESSHLGEVFERLKAYGPWGAQACYAHLVLFDEARPCLALLTRLFVH